MEAAAGPANQDEEQRASWPELFFDLVFVLALTGTADRLDDVAHRLLALIAVGRQTSGQTTAARAG